MLRGTFTADAIYPRQQLTTAEFTAASVGALASQVSGVWRAVAAFQALDAAHGLSPLVQTGDRVDVYGQLGGTVGLVLPNVLVLATPTEATPGSTAPVSGTYILRVPTGKAPKFAYMGPGRAPLAEFCGPVTGRCPRSLIAFTASNTFLTQGAR